MVYYFRNSGRLPGGRPVPLGISAPKGGGEEGLGLGGGQSMEMSGGSGGSQQQQQLEARPAASPH